jgi:hypothetical protein
MLLVLFYGARPRSQALERMLDILVGSAAAAADRKAGVLAPPHAPLACRNSVQQQQQQQHLPLLLAAVNCAGPGVLYEVLRTCLARW